MTAKQRSAAAEGSRPLAMPRPITLRAHLVRLTLATLLPVIALAVLGALLFAQHAKQTFERGARDRTLALVTAVDAQLHGSISVLAGLAQSVHLETGDLQAFYDQAARVVASRSDWLTVNLAPPSGQQIVNVLRPYPGELPSIAERNSFDRVLATARPAVGDTVFGSLTRQIDFPVRVPVVRDGRVEYVLSAVVRPEPFTVRLPRIGAPHGTPDPAPAPVLGPRRVLVIEDNDDAREMLAVTLELAGHEVLQRADGLNGVAAACALRPDAALVDIGLPGLDGHGVARQIRASDAGDDMLLIALTGYGQDEDMRKALEAGFNAHLAKPADADRLLRLIAAGRGPSTSEARSE